MAKKKQTFEQALEQLSTLAEQIEQGEIGLEDSIAKYEEGMKLLQHCRAILSNAESKIELLQQKGDGTLETKPFSKPADGASSPSETD